MADNYNTKIMREGDIWYKKKNLASENKQHSNNDDAITTLWQFSSF